MLGVRNILIFLALMSAPVHQALAYEHNFQNSEDHKFSAGETIHVSVLNEEELTNDYKIDDTGSILMPLIGKVHIAGLDAYEIEVFLTTYLMDGYLWNPVVSVTAVNTKGFYILGAVKNPGHYDMPQDNINILKAVALAGGFAKRANKRKFEIIRSYDGEEQHTIDNPPMTRLNAGDLIIVKEGFF